MSAKLSATVLGATLFAASALGLGACGREGLLDQPPPLFGKQAKDDYAAKQAARAAQPAANPQATAAAADQPDPDADNAPRTARDLKAPTEQNVPISKEPILGIPDPNGPTPSMTPNGDR